MPSKKDLRRICEDFQLRFVVLFGSGVSGAIHRESDLDIAVYPENGFEEKASKLEHELGKLFKNPRIDLINLKTAGPLLQKEVAVSGKILYARDKESFPFFQMYAVKAYYDFSPFLRLRQQAVADRINKFSHES